MPVYPLLAALVLLPPLDARDEARARFDAGDYPGAERAILEILESRPDSPPEERALLLSKLAESRALQGIAAGAVEAIEQARRLSNSTPVRQSSVLVYLRALRYRDLLEPSESLLRERPGDGGLRFAHGVALAKTGRPELAIEDLRTAAQTPQWRRDARFELALCLSKLARTSEALVQLREMLEADPYDAEAVHQTARQLLRLGNSEASSLAARLVRYFEALRERERESSRSEHLGFAGKPVEAGLERAARLERVGAIERAVAEASRLKAFPGGEAAASAWLDGLERRLGVAPRSSRADLETALASAIGAGNMARAQSLARALLTRDPRSRAALGALLDSTRDPALSAPRLHYLSRLCEADPSNDALRSELATLRAAFEGLVRAR